MQTFFHVELGRQQMSGCSARSSFTRSGMNDTAGVNDSPIVAAPGVMHHDSDLAEPLRFEALLGALSDHGFVPVGPRAVPMAPLPAKKGVLGGRQHEFTSTR